MENIYNIGRIVIVSIFFYILVVIALTDIRTKKIPDSLVLSLGVCGLFSIPFFVEISLAERLLGVLGVSLFLILITCIVPGSFGGGDIKLMAASGIFLGGKRNDEAFVIALILAGIYCVIMLVGGKIGRKSQVSFGPFLCVGIMVKSLLLM